MAANALKGNKKMESLTIEKNVRKIGKNAFANCRKLKKVTIKSKKINTIGKNAFKDCYNLTVYLESGSTLKVMTSA